MRVYACLCGCCYRRRRCCWWFLSVFNLMKYISNSFEVFRYKYIECLETFGWTTHSKLICLISIGIHHWLRHTVLLFSFRIYAHLKFPKLLSRIKCTHKIMCASKAHKRARMLHLCWNSMGSLLNHVPLSSQCVGWTLTIAQTSRL